MDYFKEFPNEKGFFGEYGGSFVPPELQVEMDTIIQSVNPTILLTNCVPLESISRADPHRFITAKISVKFAEEGFI